MVVPISDIVECMEMADLESQFYFDRKKEEIVHVYDKMVNGESNPSLAEEIQDSLLEDYVPLPSVYDIDDYQLMVDFTATLSDLEMREKLYRLLQGKGAFRRFKEGIYKEHLEEQWYDYRSESYQKIANHWCQKYSIQGILR